MTPCPSTLALGIWEAEPRRPGTEAITEHLGQCRRCAAFLGEVTAARQLLGDPVHATAAARRIAAAVERRRTQRPAVGAGAALGMGALLLAAAAGFLLIPRADRLPARPVTAESGVVRAKGAFVFEVFCKRGESIFAASDGGEFLPGDQLRFAYRQATPGYLMVFSVDDRGQVFPYYDSGALKSVPAPAGSGVFLPGAVALDDHHGWERLFALWSARPLDGKLVTLAVKNAFGRGSSVQDRARLEVAAEQVSLLLRRP